MAVQTAEKSSTRGGAGPVMAEAVGRKLVAERKSYSTLNVPLLFICRIIRNYLVKGMTREQNKIYIM